MKGKYKMDGIKVTVKFENENTYLEKDVFIQYDDDLLVVQQKLNALIEILMFKFVLQEIKTMLGDDNDKN